MLTITITEDNVEALARTSMSEVGHFGRYGEETLKGAVEAVVDTILNRVAHPSYPDTIDEVVNARFQFSAIGGPGGVKTWRRLPKASDAVFGFVAKHLGVRAGGGNSTVEGATHFLNPFFSSPRALSTWGNHVVQHAVARWGKGRDIHFHGFAPGTAAPPAYRLSVENQSGGAAVTKGLALVAAALAAVVAGAAVGGALAGGQKPGKVKDGKTKPAETSAGAGAPIVEETATDGSMLAYHVEEVPIAEAASVNEVLNRFSAEGWRMRQIVPVPDKLLLVFEGDDLEQFVHESDERPDDEEEIKAPHVVTDNTPEGQFGRFLTGRLRLDHFHPSEFLVLGGQNLSGPAKGKNTLPPEDLWENILPTAKALDVLRGELGAAIRLSSVYRSPAYNALLPGAAGGSTHMQFRATDFTCADGRGPVWWAGQLKRLRDQGHFVGGIGVYPTFVHIDTRGQNVKFGPWMNRVFG